jgi:formylglycine-generating enzyme
MCRGGRRASPMANNGRTHPIGGKAPNELGLYDMSGNVSEWCWDWTGDYPSGSESDPWKR